MPVFSNLSGCTVTRWPLVVVHGRICWLHCEGGARLLAQSEFWCNHSPAGRGGHAEVGFQPQHQSYGHSKPLLGWVGQRSPSCVSSSSQLLCYVLQLRNHHFSSAAVCTAISPKLVAEIAEPFHHDISIALAIS